MDWLSYYNQAYELQMAVYSIKARTQTSGDSVRMVMGMAVENIEKRIQELIKLGDNARANSERAASFNQTRPAEAILWEQQSNLSAGDGAEAKPAGSGN